jgi:hypothetical protein
MTAWTIRSAACALFALSAGAAAAQEESTNRVGANTDWSVFVEGDPKECWAVSQPKETVNTRDGRVVAVRRGDILLFVTYRPSDGDRGEIAFTGGYPFAGDSTVSLDVGGTKFDLTPDPANAEWAYPASPEEDARIVTALKAGAQAILVGRSSRGTTTTDTFSLLGFTASVEDAAQRCAE